MSIAHACLPQWIESLHLHIYSALKMTSHALLQNRHDDVTRTRRHSTPYQCLRPTTVDFRLLVTSWKKENETNRSNSPYSVTFGTACIGLVSFHDGTSNLKSTVTPTLHCSLSQPSLSTDTYVGMVAAVCMLYNYIISTGSVNSCIHVM